MVNGVTAAHNRSSYEEKINVWKLVVDILFIICFGLGLIVFLLLALLTIGIGKI